MIRGAALPKLRRGDTEAYLLTLDGSFADQLFEDPPDHPKTLRLIPIEDPIHHRPPSLHVKNFRELQSVIAAHNKLGARNLIKDVRPDEEPFRELRIGQCDKGVQLLLKLSLIPP